MKRLVKKARRWGTVKERRMMIGWEGAFKPRRSGTK
jgi:hypothetical protein